ncbi:hypothetical protein QH494_25390 [Sphingomonas sp. AR_OL41]|uniref:hypothetical protein n=1 Tax=Sphingomonas sp. AR_OL41 TaxID=3042729 RepID=UPI0024817269|nr:hypothetical protein [Sphingomonas sp. AR_OL41]MDH7975534.1 hypothetical protein [Sphingomonas sp. AR_OL41]
MFKLYKRVSDGIEYHEAWAGGRGVVEHWGRCGTRGETKEHFADPGKEQGVMDDIRDRAVANGFAPVHEEDFDWMLVHRSIDGFGTSDDLVQRHALEDYLNEELGWFGLGHCDGGSIGSGSIEAACPVVDYEIAASALASRLANSPFSNFSISRESEMPV